VTPRTPPVDLSVRFGCEPPLDSADRLAFACMEHAERLMRDLVSRGLVCTELRVELTDDIGMRHERKWSHPSRFSAADVVNRVRWQAAAMPQAPERGGSGVAAVLLTPVRTARAADHEPGLWSTAPDERVHHHLSRVQSLLGHRGVGTGELTGGRLSADRQRLVPWGAGSEPGPGSARRPGAGPWPGRLPGPVPNAVFGEALAAALLDDAGAAVELRCEAGSEAQGLASQPARLSVQGSILPAAVRAWSSLWPLRERWWDGARRSGIRYRLQLLLDDGDAWLLRYEAERGWLAEARYA